MTFKKQILKYTSFTLIFCCGGFFIQMAYIPDFRSGPGDEFSADFNNLEKSSSKDIIDNMRVHRAILNVRPPSTGINQIKLQTNPPKNIMSASSNNHSTITQMEDTLLKQLANIETLQRKIKLMRTQSRKSILLLGGVMDEDKGQRMFLREKCPHYNCHVTSNKSLLHDLDNAPNVVIFQNDDPDYLDIANLQKPWNQLWILMLLESPFNSIDLTSFRDRVNWTATYRWDSTLVNPYAKYKQKPKHLQSNQNDKNFAKGKTKLIAWFVSNCDSKNGRLAFVKELQKHIPVDIYGYCGPLKCDRRNEAPCFRMLKNKYKFYLSFENSNCKDYITEKFYRNALRNDIVPVVMGAKYEEYQRMAPPGSFIHVDSFRDPKGLAEYLQRIHSNDTLYNEFFKWKGQGDFIDTKLWCRLCTMLNTPMKPHWYEDIDDWWRGPGVCSPLNSDDSIKNGQTK